MSRKSNNISILQFSDHQISRLRVRRSPKGLEVLSFESERGEWSARDGSLESALKAFAAKNGLADDQIYSVVARHEMTARILDLPSQDPAEIAGMIRLSAEEYVPFPVEELLIDQCVLHKLPDGHAKVLAVFAHQDVVNGHVKTLAQAGLEPEQILLSTACLASAAVAAKAKGRYALVDLASEGLEVVVLNAGRLEYGRAVASAQDWGKTSDSMAELLEELRVEVRASLSAYRRSSDDGESVDQIYVCSDFTDVSTHCAELAQEFEQECGPAQFVRDLISSGSVEAGLIPATSLGAALLAQDRGAVSVQLLPQSLVSARQRVGVKKRAVQLGVVAGFVLVALGVIYGQAVYQRQAYVRDLRDRIGKIESSAQQIESKNDQLRILQEQVNREGSAMELMSSLVDLYPSVGMNITRLVFNRQESLEIYGRAENLSQVERLAQELIDIGKKSLKQFARAEQAYEHKVMERNVEVLDYKIVVPFPTQETEEPEQDEEEGEDIE